MFIPTAVQGAQNPQTVNTGIGAIMGFVGVMIGLVILIAIVSVVMTRRRQVYTSKPIHSTSADAPPLVGMIAQQGELVLLADGYTPANMRYSYVVGLSLVYSEHPLYGLYTVELPFVSSAHILGESRQQGIPISVKERGSMLEKMELEGDYPTYFTLYVEHQQQSAGRYVLDPAAMAFTVDFCRQYDWEIVGDQLFFLSDQKVPDFQLVDTFIEQIRPAIEDHNKQAHHESHDLPYVTKQPLTMDCPLCHERLIAKHAWLECPNHEGVLLTGEQLQQLRERADLKTLREALSEKQHPGGRHLTCPYCSTEMNEGQYQNTNLYIDVCSACRYRWLDYKEIPTITGVTKSLGEI